MQEGDGKMNTTITAIELHEMLKGGEAVTVIDTLPPEYYEQGHIPGALNACVYEMVFLDRMGELQENRDSRLVVYGSSDRSHGAEVAVEKLKRAGYHDVYELAGGLEAWSGKGFRLESSGSGQTEEALVIADGLYAIDAAASRLEWSGRNIAKRHHGTIAVSRGSISIENGLPLSGEFVLDMNAIVNLDLEDEAFNSMLIRHLKSDDFFDVARYPTATYRLGTAEALPGATPGSPNYLLKGVLELKGKQRSLNLAAEVAVMEQGVLKARAACDFDRTLWGVIYGSGRFFEKLGMHLVSDLVTVEIFLQAVRQGG